MPEKTQKEIWNEIAEEWHSFKDKPAENVMEFLLECKGNILDLGSGSGRHLAKIKNGKMFLIDFSEEMIKLAKEKSSKEKIPAEFSVSELYKIPYENDFFDAAICISALHCVQTAEGRESTIKELHRVLKPKAKALIGVWNKDSKRFKNSPKERTVGWRDIGKRFYYLYEPKEVYELFEKNGFKIVKKYEPARMISFVVEKC